MIVSRLTPARRSVLRMLFPSKGIRRQRTAFSRGRRLWPSGHRRDSVDVARKSAWQSLNKTNDPRLSMLRRFAKAVGVEVKDRL
jgi:hypothetical protein